MKCWNLLFILMQSVANFGGFIMNHEQKSDQEEEMKGSSAGGVYTTSYYEG